MRRRFTEATISTSSTTERNDFNIRSHFRWESIQKFVYLAHAFSTTCSSFDMFSKVLVVRVHIFEYIIYTIFIGVSYMFMDFFIKQYTRRIDTNKHLNPLMRGVSFGILLQTVLWTIVHASDLADSLRYFFLSMKPSPSWAKCKNIQTNVTCIPSQDIVFRCGGKIKIPDFRVTSAHIYYKKTFSHKDKHSLSTRFFVIAIVWIGNFFITTVTDNALLMIFKLSFMWGTFSTAFILIFLLFSTKYTAKAFYDIMDIKDFFNRKAFNLVTDPFGIGLIGVYDFGTMSPVTMIDNAVIIFAIVFVVSAFARSFIVRVLYLVLTNCVETKIINTPHYLLFAVLPLSTEFMNVHKIFILYVYSYITTALVACLAMFTSIISRLLHSEFRSIKNIYIVGLFCFLGFNLSLPLSALEKKKRKGIMYGLKTCSIYFGGIKAAIVMWMYGVQTFSTDIHFWLGFKPTQFWKCIWAMMPAIVFMIACMYINDIRNLKDQSQKVLALTWICLSLLIQIIIDAKTIVKYIMKNNLAGIFKSNFKYGPPDIDDRKRRKYFDEIAESRQCQHNCMILDERYECNHMPLIFKNRSSVPSSESSLTNIYQGPSGKRSSKVIDVSVLPNN